MRTVSREYWRPGGGGSLGITDDRGVLFFFLVEVVKMSMRCFPSIRDIVLQGIEAAGESRRKYHVADES